MNSLPNLRRAASSLARRQATLSIGGQFSLRPLHLVPFRINHPAGDGITSRSDLRRQMPLSLQYCVFSTDSTSSTDAAAAAADPDLSTLSHLQLEQLALKYARQINPVQSQRVLEHIQSTSGVDAEELAILRTSVVDAWLEYQRQQMTTLTELVQHAAPPDSSVLHLVRDRLEEICHAAESASELIEAELQKKSSSGVTQHHILAILRGWATACEATRMMAGLTTSRPGDWSGIPQRMQHILTKYQQVSGTTTTAPSVEAVNQVLKAWAYSREHLRGTMAEQFFQEKTPPYDGDTFRYMIRAWSWSKEKRCAFTATGHFMRMMRLLETTGKPDMEPSLEDYRILFQAWTTAEDKNAPSKVQTLLQLADSSYRKGLTKVRPDLKCYTYALQTMSQRVNVPEVGELADQTLSEMKKERMIIPNTECYGSAILAWKHVAMGRECDDREGAIQRAFDLLREMIAAFHRTTIVTVRPTTEHYNHVLEALTVSKSSRATQKVEKLLSELEKAGGEVDVEEQDDDEEEEALEDSPRLMSNDKQVVDLAPNADSYKFALMVWRNSKSPHKLDSARDLLSRFTSRIEQLRNVSSEKSLVEVMSAFISVCARDGSNKDRDEKMKVMLTALRTLESMRALGLTPDSTTYAALLEACDSLVDDGQDRQRILENIFGRACSEGYVDQAVLQHFKAAASTYLYAKLLVAPSMEVEHMKVVPEGWTRNVQGFSVNSKGGRKVLPLTIDGQFTFTKAAAEFKMRKLRKQANKKMLQGGRMK